MPWKVKVHKDKLVIETTYSGLINPDELKAAVYETLNQAQLHGAGLLLGDCTTLVGGHSVIDLYYLAAAMKENNMRFIIKEAVILPKCPGSIETVKFWENISLNEGLMVQVFTDRKSAMDWLLNINNEPSHTLKNKL
jgi:hypothetical protein